MKPSDSVESPADPVRPVVADAIAALCAGELIVYPTETLYALGADALSPGALERLFAAKAREAGKPVALIVSDAASAFELAREVPRAARLLARRFWPGPLTLVIPARHGLHEALVGGDGGVGVRVSPHPIASALARGLGHAITATSANPSGGTPAPSASEARTVFGDKVKVFVEGGRLAGAAPSTVVSVHRTGITIIREAAISAAQISAALAKD